MMTENMLTICTDVAGLVDVEIILSSGLKTTEPDHWLKYHGFDGR